MKESDYPHYHQLNRGDVYTAVECFHTYLEIHNFAGENTNVYRAMNKCAAFWNIQLYSLQSNFFIVLARIFDKRRDVHSVHKLLTATVDHPEFFSKTALGARKQNEAGNRKIGWLPDYLADAWEPSVHDLRDLKKALDPHKAKFEAVYLPIRHKIFAHKAFDDVALVSNLIAKAIIKEIDDVLCFLFNLIEFLWQLFHNGRKIKLDGQAEYVSHKERIKGTTREVLVALAASQVN